MTVLVTTNVHLEPDDEISWRVYPRPSSDLKVGGALNVGPHLWLSLGSPAQCFVVIEQLRALADHWQDELLLASRMGDDYVLAPYETPASHRDDLADAGIDREAC